MKRELRGIQIVAPYKFGCGNVSYHEDFKQMTVDCHLGSLIVTADDLLDYLKKRNTRQEQNKLQETSEKLREYLISEKALVQDFDIPDEIYEPWREAIDG